jgi:ketosteroid isomerase-like protein
MADNVEVLRGAYEAFGRGDMEAVTATWWADIEFEGPNSSRMPGAGPSRGKEEVARLFSGMRDRWDGLLFSTDEFVEQGETVVVLGHLEGRAKATGTDVKVPFVHVWRMREGKVARGQALTDTAVVADALGT